MWLDASVCQSNGWRSSPILNFVTPTLKPLPNLPSGSKDIVASKLSPSPRPKIYKFSNIRSFNCPNFILSYFDPDKTSVIQSCNCFSLCETRYLMRHSNCPLYSFRVLNPTTKCFLMLPPFPKKICKFKYIKIPSLYLDFDPLRSFHFKVVSFIEVEHGKGSRFEAYVYSSKSDSWSETGVFYTGFLFHPPSGVYCNGAVHWYDPHYISVYFDVDQQCFKALPEPKFEGCSDVYVKYFGEFGGNLHLGLTKIDESRDLKVLVMKKDYTGWVLRYNIYLNHIVPEVFSILPPRPAVCVLYVACGANEDKSMLALYVDNKIMFYNLNDHTLRIIDEEIELRDIIHDKRKVFHQ